MTFAAPQPRRSRRGAVLPATLAVLAISILAAMGALSLADAERATVSGSLERAQARLLAWSGVQAAMAELSAQRADIFSGRPPVLTESWAMHEKGLRRAVVRLMPIGPGGEAAVSETAKIDLNTAPAEVLARVPGLEQAARQIVDARSRQPFGSVEELVGVGGVTAGALRSAAEDGGVPLEELVTVWSFDPNIQAGLGTRGAGHEGELRVNINMPWSDRLSREIARRFDEQTAAAVQRIMTDGRTFGKDADIVATLRAFNVEPGEWLEALDAFTTCAEQFVPGRVDVNMAREEVLACLPGFDAASAGAVTAQRSRLDGETLRSVAWPASEGVLTPEQFQEAVGMLATRSGQWRIRVEAGYEPLDAPLGDDAESPLQSRVVMDAVIDIAAERPRVAYLRDATGMELADAFRLATEDEDAGPEHEPPADEPLPEPLPEPAAEPAAEPASQPGPPRRAGGSGGPRNSAPPVSLADTEPPESPAPEAPPPSAAGVSDEDNRRGRWTARSGGGT